jgi:Tfp pilus assembly protein PilF
MMQKNNIGSWLLVQFVLWLTVTMIGCSWVSLTEEERKQNEYHKKLGVSLLLENNLQQSYVELQKAIKLNSGDKEAFNYIGLIHSEWGQFEKAIEFYNKAISIDSNYGEAYNNRGLSYLKLKRWDEALENFRNAISKPMYDTPEKAYYNMGVTYYLMGDNLKALDSLNNALVRAPGYVRANYFIGLIYQKLGRNKDAITEFKKAAEANPYFIEVQFELAKAYLNNGDRENALCHFRQVIQFGDDSKIELKKEAQRYIDFLKIE